MSKEKQKLTFEQECSLIANGEDLPQEKQIEEMEMAREIHKALLNCHNNYNCHKCEFMHDTPMSFCKAEYIAKAISEYYQPKIDKDSVVLSKSELEEIKN